MDKICRNSQVGAAHVEGSFQENVADTSTFARGTHLTVHSMKLDNTEPGRGSRHKRSQVPADHFRSQDWFRHDAGNSTANKEVAHLSPRFWKGAAALSPAPSPRSQIVMSKSKSQKSLAKGAAAALGVADGSQRSPQRAMSEAVLPFSSLARDAAGASPKTGASSPRYDRDFNCSPLQERARSPGLPLAGGGSSPERREHSPTFRVSEDWMGYSSTRERSPSPEYTDYTMPSSNFSARTRRQHSGRVSENSENWAIRHDLGGERSPPVVANIVTNIASKGKKTGLHKDEQKMKRRLALDTTQADPLRSHRQHHFPEHPQIQAYSQGLRSYSPRLSQQMPDGDDTGGGSRGSRSSPQVVDVQHRTSPELRSSIAPEHEVYGNTEAPSVEQQKYMVGNRIVTWETGRKPCTECIQAHTTGLPPKLAQAASVGNLRDHRNSDVLREHLQPMQYVEAPAPLQHYAPASVAVSPAASTLSYACPGQVPQVLPARAEQRIYSYGDISSLPSNMPKDTAYLHSGLKLVKFGGRASGAYSPNVHRILASQVMPS